MEVSLFPVSLSPTLSFVGELNVLIRRDQGKPPGRTLTQFCLDEAGSWEPLSLGLPSAGETP